MSKKLFFRLCMSVSLFFCYVSQGQTLTYPESAVDQSYIPPSPNAQGFQIYGNDPVSLFEGVPAISIPIYTVKCGSISLPISLSYNYNGFLPLQDAGWVGLGWNLNAGGAISRTVEGGVDNSQNSGYNYGQYNLVDSLSQGALADSFLQRAYNPNLAYPHTSYDMAPDIYDAEFNGYSGKFFWYNNKAYQLSYSKDMGINLSSPTGIFTITTADGVQYIFSNTETTTSYYYGGADSAQQSYISAWVLNQVVSADKKDTITLNYTSYTWQQATISYQTSYTLNTGSGGDIGYDPLSFKLNPSISTCILKSIVCRNSRVSFISDSAVRTDIIGNYARLREIDVIDSITGNTVKKNTFSYEYFGQRVTNPAMYERLALKRFNLQNPLLSNDSLTYTFKYIHEYDTAFPAKSTYAMDYFGYYNGQTANATFLPSPNATYYNPAPPGGSSFSSASRNPSASYCSYGALDTIVYPAGGYTSFTYQGNVCNGNGGVGPGICLQSSITVSNNPTSPQTIQKNYAYLLDDGATSSGVLTTMPNFTGPTFVYVLNGTASNYNTYKAPSNSNGIGGISPKFFYQKVTETVAAGAETHKTDHYFTSYSGLFLDVMETGRIDYINTNTVNANAFTPVAKTISAYYQTGSMDTFFQAASAYIDTEYASATHNPKNWYAYSGTYADWSTYWVHPNYQQTTQYDKYGDSIVTITYYFYDSISNNVSSTLTQNLSDGQSIIKKFKYPEDYSTALTGNMVSARVLSPPVESQTWLYKNSADSILISGSITQFDQTIYKPVSTYAIETTKPITSLNNETRSGGRFTSILSDSRYILKGQIQYDGNNNLSVANKASDINISYIWDYRHCQPVANVKNAAQADIAYTSFEADGTGNWSFTGTATASSSSPTGSYYYNLGQSGGNITKSGLTSSTFYIVSYWTSNASALTITGTQSGYPLNGKTINGWTYYEHKITGQTSVTISGSGNIDELRLYPANAQMTSYTYTPLVGMSSQCDADNRVTYYQYDGFGRLKVVLDQDHNIIKTVQYHTNGETTE